MKFEIEFEPIIGIGIGYDGFLRHEIILFIPFVAFTIKIPKRKY